MPEKEINEDCKSPKRGGENWRGRALSWRWAGKRGSRSRRRGRSVARREGGWTMFFLYAFFNVLALFFGFGGVVSEVHHPPALGNHAQATSRKGRCNSPLTQPRTPRVDSDFQREGRRKQSGGSTVFRCLGGCSAVVHPVSGEPN